MTTSGTSKPEDGSNSSGGASSPSNTVLAGGADLITVFTELAAKIGTLVTSTEALREQAKNFPVQIEADALAAAISAKLCSQLIPTLEVAIRSGILNMASELAEIPIFNANENEKSGQGLVSADTDSNDLGHNHRLVTAFRLGFAQEMDRLVSKIVVAVNGKHATTKSDDSAHDGRRLGD